MPPDVALDPFAGPPEMFDRLEKLAAGLIAALKRPDLSDEQRAEGLACLKQLREKQGEIVRFMRRQRNDLRLQLRTVRTTQRTAHLQSACVRRPRPRQYRPRRVRVSRGPRKARAPDDPDPEHDPAVTPLARLSAGLLTSPTTGRRWSE